MQIYILHITYKYCVLYRSLPNWHHLQHSEDTSLAISEEERKSLNLKESQILTSNLSAQDSMIAPHEILSEPVQLKLIGNLHESLVWQLLVPTSCLLVPTSCLLVPTTCLLVPTTCLIITYLSSLVSLISYIQFALDGCYTKPVLQVFLLVVKLLTRRTMFYRP